MNKAVLLAGVAAVVGAGAAAAQEAAAGREVIIVTTQKREQALRDVPINVNTFTGDQLGDLGVSEFEDLAEFIPGLEIEAQSPNNPGFAIRGITSDDGASNVEPRVSVYLDGVPASKARGSYFELYDIERVEVAKGPQSTLYGRAALIGAINVIQTKPENEFGFGGKAAGGDQGYHRVEAYVNAPLVDDLLSVRLSGFSGERDGFIENAIGGPDLNSTDTVAWRASARMTPSNAMTIDFVYNQQEDTPTGTSFKSGTIGVPGGDLSPFSAAALNTFGGFEGGRDLSVDRDIENAALSVAYDINDAWTLTSITAARWFDSLEVFDPDGSFLEFIVAAEDTEGDQFSQELRLNYDAGGRIEAFGGVNVYDEEVVRRIPFATNEAVAQAVLAPELVSALGLPNVAAGELLLAQGVAAQIPAPVLGLFGVSPADIPNLSLDQLNAILVGVGQPAVNLDDPTNPYPFSAFALATLGQQIPLRSFYQEEITDFAETQAFDLFGDVTVHVTERFDLIAGLRLSYDDKKAGAFNTLTTQNLVAPFPTLLLPTTLSATGQVGGAVKGEDSFNGESWRLVGKYALSDTANVWASYARGRRPEVLSVDNVAVDPTPGFPGDEFNALGQIVVVPEETVDSFEVGGFADLFGGALAVQGSAFYYTYENFQIEVLEQGFFRTINAGDAGGPGAEVAFQWAPAGFVDVFGSYAFNGVRLDDGDTRFRLSPDHSASIGARFSHALGGGEAFFLPTYAYRSEVFFENGEPETVYANGFALKQDGYGVLDAKVGFAHDAGWAVEAFVKNALDEEYLIDAGNTGLSFGSPTFIAGAPRLYGVQVSGRF